MLTLNLTPIFNARGINRPYSFLVKAGLSPHAANAIVNSETRSFRLDHIELLCRVLVCEPNDLLQYTPGNDQQLPANHPLNNLLQEDNLENMKQTLATMPFKKLKEINKQVNNNTTSS